MVRLPAPAAHNRPAATTPTAARARTLTCPRCGSSDITFDFDVTVSVAFRGGQFRHVTDHLPVRIFCPAVCADYAPTPVEQAWLHDALDLMEKRLPASVVTDLREEQSVAAER